MRIAFTCNKLNNGGAERVICNIANRMVQDGHEVKIICLCKTDSFYYYLDDAIAVVELDKSANNLDKSFLSRKIDGLKNLNRLKNAITGSDIVISFYTRQNCYSIFVCKLLNIPIICAERDHFFLQDGRINQILRNVFYPLADGFIHQTSMMRTELRNKSGVRCKDVVIPNPLWMTDFPPRNPIEGYVAAVGRLEDQKNYIEMIRAFAMAHEKAERLSLHIFGAGPMRKDIENFVESIGLQKVIILEGITKDIRTVFEKSDIYVLFSKGEGYPNALMEALACGVPSISSACPVGGPEDMINDGVNGILVPTNDVTALSDAIIKLVNDDQMKKKFSEESTVIRTTNEFTRIYRQWMNYIEEVIYGY